MRRTLAVIVLLGVAVAGALHYTRAVPMAAADIPAHSADVANGERMFHVGGCMSCHKPETPAGAQGEALPSGGAAFKTPVGTFYPPNLTPDRETGIGDWSDADFLNAMLHGVSPDRRHYFPAFPYMSYARMTVTDLLDLKNYLVAMEPVRSPRRSPDMLFSLPVEGLARRSIGLWKRLAASEKALPPDPARSVTWNRGRYLVNGPGHCGECHTPRNFFMVPKSDEAFAGGPHPDGDGTVPSLRSLVERGRYKDVADITMALQYGETLGYDKISKGGMGSVQINIAKLPPDDIAAIAEYLLSL